MAKEYIEREAAVELFQNAQFEYTAEEAAEFVSRIPAADVRLVKRGKWIEEFDGFYRSYTCSECGEYALTKEETMHDTVCSNFCPNCGADMREVQDDN